MRKNYFVDTKYNLDYLASDPRIKSNVWFNYLYTGKRLCEL